MGCPDSVRHKRELYASFVAGRADASEDDCQTIHADLPRTFHDVVWVRNAEDRIAKLLTEYAAVHRADGYLQGFNYAMTLLLFVFKDCPDADADTWWCFSRIVGLIRPLMPDFNVAWFDWYRRHWLGEFHQRLAKHCPRLEMILSQESETFSALITVKWFMIWFAQTVPFDDLLVLWDFLIERPPSQLMNAYMLLTFEILRECAPDISYNWPQNPANFVHHFLDLRVEGITEVVTRARRHL